MNKIVFTEVAPGKRLTYDHGDEGGADSPPTLDVTVTFAEHDGRTLPASHAQFDTPEQCAATKKFGAVEGGFRCSPASTRTFWRLKATASVRIAPSHSPHRLGVS